MIATGGLARFITPLCRHKIIYDDALLLKRTSDPLPEEYAVNAVKYIECY